MHQQGDRCTPLFGVRAPRLKTRTYSLLVLPKSLPHLLHPAQHGQGEPNQQIKQEGWLASLTPYTSLPATSISFISAPSEAKYCLYLKILCPNGIFKKVSSSWLTTHNLHDLGIALLKIPSLLLALRALVCPSLCVVRGIGCGQDGA